MSDMSEAIKNNDMAAYQAARYPAIPDGESVVFRDEDFSGINFGQFSVGFFEFHDCNLDDVSELYGQPITIKGGTARNIDLRGARAIIKAANCDFSGMQYDESTKLVYGEGDSATRSEFVECNIDAEAGEYLQRQGVAVR